MDKQLDPALKEQLSPAALRALMQHLGADAPSQSDDENSNESSDNEEFIHERNTNAGVDEDFGLSQFWYTKETSRILAREALTLGGTYNKDEHSGVLRIAFVSCPSAHAAALELLETDEFKDRKDDLELYIFEYDTRFGDVYGDQFVFFDFNNPQYINEEYLQLFDYVMADPPYLEEQCMQKTVTAMKSIARSEDTPMAFNTGSVMCDAIYEYAQFRESKYHPQHQSKLGNEFSCFTNYDPVNLDGWYPLEEKEAKKNDFLPRLHQKKTE